MAKRNNGRDLRAVEIRKSLSFEDLKDGDGGILNKFGEVGASTTEQLIKLRGDNMGLGASFPGYFLRAPERIQAVSTSANDGAGQTGAQTVKISGINDLGDWDDEVITIEGALSSKSFWRVLRAEVYDCGTRYGNNLGVITIQTSGFVNLMDIAIGAGQSQTGIITIPRAHEGFLEQITYTYSGSDKDMIYRIYTNESFTNDSAPFKGLTQKRKWGTNDSVFKYEPKDLPKIPELTDFIPTCEIDGGGSGVVTVDIEMLIFPTARLRMVDDYFYEDPNN